MAELVTDCSRCGAKSITLDVHAAVHMGTKYDWQRWYEAFCVCRRCSRPSIILLAQANIEPEPPKNLGAKSDTALNKYFRVQGPITLKDSLAADPPEHIPKDIEAVYREGSICLRTQCFNAAATMFRLCVDMATKSLLPAGDENGLNNKIRRNLGLRVPWLIKHQYLPAELEDLSDCIKEDGNDGAHEGTLTKADAEDVQDFTEALLERLYTEPERLRLAKERRVARRAG